MAIFLLNQIIPFNKFTFMLQADWWYVEQQSSEYLINYQFCLTDPVKLKGNIAAI